jgi:hypothetical protein
VFDLRSLAIWRAMNAAVAGESPLRAMNATKAAASRFESGVSARVCSWTFAETNR